MSQEFKDLPQHPEKLSKLSPQKYGKGAYAELTYTPSKLKENILYIEAATMKKNQQKDSQLRQIKAENQLLQDRLDQLKRQKQGVQLSLNQQIVMYKKFIAQMEAKYEQNIKNIQVEFSAQMSVIIKENEEKAKIAQAERQELQRIIQQLQLRNSDLEGKLGEANKYIQHVTGEKQKLHLSQKQINFELEELKQMKKLHEGKSKNQYDDLKKQLFQKQQNWKTETHNARIEKQKQIDNLKRQSMQDLSKLQQKLESETMLKNSQIQQITKTFNSEVERLNERLKEKQEVILELKRQLNEDKQRLIETTKNYDKEINVLIFQKNKALNQLDAARFANVKAVPVGINLEINNLRQLLLQSSSQLQKCKEELLLMDRQRNNLLLKLGEAGYDSQILYRSRRDRLWR